jgi:cell division protein FtsB
MVEQQSKGIKKIIGPILGFFVTVYFVYHIFQGERGFISWIRISKIVKQDETILSDLNKQKEALERRVVLLRPESLDTDMLEEVARKMFNYSKADETIIHEEKKQEIIKKNEKGIHS